MPPFPPRHRASLLLVFALPLCACTHTTTPVTRGGEGPGLAGAGTCDAGKAQWAVGQAAEQATVGKAWRESGAGLIRPVAPGQAARHDVRTDRLTIDIDKANVITALSCR